MAENLSLLIKPSFARKLFSKKPLSSTSNFILSSIYLAIISMTYGRVFVLKSSIFFALFAIFPNIILASVYEPPPSKSPL